MKRLLSKVIQIAAFKNSREFYYSAEQAKVLRQCENYKIQCWMSCR